jgi:transcriptional regulator
MIELRPNEELRDLLDRQSAQFEHQLSPKTPWTTRKMTPDVSDRMMRQIVPCRMRIKDITGTWKLSQNKADNVREKTADQIEVNGLGNQVTRLASFMRDVLPQDK